MIPAPTSNGEGKDIPSAVDQCRRVCLERRFEILTAVLKVTVLSVMQCEAAWCYVTYLYHPRTTLTPAHVTRLIRNKQYSTTVVSSETQSYSIEFIPPHVMKADRGDDV